VTSVSTLTNFTDLSALGVGSAGAQVARRFQSFYGEHLSDEVYFIQKIATRALAHLRRCARIRRLLVK